jgi:hypothetical protein
MWLKKLYRSISDGVEISIKSLLDASESIVAPLDEINIRSEKLSKSSFSSGSGVVHLLGASF